jgi:HD-GYP domain-containing protein (c-di-GMP phosphodiesterase class II)
MESFSAVNRHYLDHLIALSGSHGAEAIEDIFAERGMKLLAKGARIDASTRERLLQHRLRKPLEDCVRFEHNLSRVRIGQEAEALLDQSSLLQSLYSGRSNAEATRNLRELELHPKLQALNTLYADSQPGKLPHAVGASLLCSGLMNRLKPGDTVSQRIVMTAGLSHDIGELYVDPAPLAHQDPLEPDDWRHVAAHPVVAQRLLASIPSVGAQVGETALNHHERLDGFGYPRGLKGEQIGMHSQVLAVCELLVGFIERSPAPLKRSHIAVSLIPGEFSRGIADLVAGICHAGSTTEAQFVQQPPLDAHLINAARVVSQPDLPRQVGEWLHAELPAPAVASLKPLFQQVVQRLTHIQRAYYSVGLDRLDPEELPTQLHALDDRDARLEVVLVLQEIAWRLKELGRETVARVSRLAPQETPRARLLADRLIGAMPVV